MAHNDEGLVPDRDIVSGIFPNVPDIPEDAYDVISSTANTCTFRIRLETEPWDGFTKDLFIRIAASRNCLVAVAAFQRLAHHQLADLVPPILAVGSTRNSKGREVDYSVTKYLDGTTTLEDVWNDLDLDNQRALVDSVAQAVEKLQKLDPRHDNLERILPQKDGSDSEPSTSIILGGPEVGYYSGMRQLLVRLAGDNRCQVLDTLDGIAIRSSFDDIGHVQLSYADLDNLRNTVVSCHNDLEPRNILVKQARLPDDDNSVRYELAAIVNWEMAGFYPFAYEIGLKDTLLGSSNLSFSWYSLFKERTTRLIPEGDCHARLIKGMRIIAQSKDRMIPGSISVLFQTRWIERQRVKMAGIARRGWIREVDDEDILVFTKEDDVNLELEVLKELGYIE